MLHYKSYQRPVTVGPSASGRIFLRGRSAVLGHAAVEGLPVLAPPADHGRQFGAHELEEPHGLGHPGPGGGVRAEDVDAVAHHPGPPRHLPVAEGDHVLPDVLGHPVVVAARARLPRPAGPGRSGSGTAPRRTPRPGWLAVARPVRPRRADRNPRSAARRRSGPTSAGSPSPPVPRRDPRRTARRPRPRAPAPRPLRG